MNKNDKKRMYFSALKKNEDYQWLSSMLYSNMIKSKMAEKCLQEIESVTISDYAQYNNIIKKLHTIRFILEEEYFASHHIKTSKYNYYQFSISDMINMREATA